MICAPKGWWVRSQGSTALPSSRVKAANLSMEVSGYLDFRVGRTGAITRRPAAPPSKVPERGERGSCDPLAPSSRMDVSRHDDEGVRT